MKNVQCEICSLIDGLFTSSNFASPFTSGTVIQTWKSSISLCSGIIFLYRVRLLHLGMQCWWRQQTEVWSNRLWTPSPCIKSRSTAKCLYSTTSSMWVIVEYPTAMQLITYFVRLSPKWIIYFILVFLFPVDIKNGNIYHSKSWTF